MSIKVCLPDVSTGFVYRIVSTELCLTELCPYQFCGTLQRVFFTARTLILRHDVYIIDVSTYYATEILSRLVLIKWTLN